MASATVERCSKCKEESWHRSGEKVCHYCQDDKKIRAFLVPEGQCLDEHFFPIEPEQKVLELTR